MDALFSRIFHPVSGYLVLDDTVEGNWECNREAISVCKCSITHSDGHDIYLYICFAGEVR